MIGGAALIAALVGWYAAPRWPGGVNGADSRTGWVVAQCDVGQGDALLLRSGLRRAVLVDAGPDPDAVDACLRRWDVRRLDLVVVTHFHADHVDGLSGALRGRGRPPVIATPCTEPREGWQRASAAAAATGSVVTVTRAGMAGELSDSGWPLRWSILWPFPPHGERAGACGRPGSEPEGAEINDASVVLVAEVRGIRVVALGDLETGAQRALSALLRGGPPTDVVKVAHHGSARQHADLYAALQPRVALIGVGAGNDYGHPAPSTLSMLRATGALVLRTDQQGDLAVVGSAANLGAATTRRSRRRSVAASRAGARADGE